MRKALTANIVILLVFFLFVPTFFLCFAENEYMPEKELSKLNEALINAYPDEDVIKNEFIPRLNNAIEKYPNDHRLIEHRLEIYAEFGLLKNAKKDAEKVIELTNSIFVRYLDCLVTESMGNGEKEEYLQCYRDVYAIYNAEKKDIDYFHLLTSSMGEMPEAEKIQTLYIESLENEELRKVYIEDFVPFKREFCLFPYAKDEEN